MAVQSESTLIPAMAKDLATLLKAAQAEADAVREEHQSLIVTCHAEVQRSSRGPMYLVPHLSRWRHRELVEITRTQGRMHTVGVVSRIREGRVGLLECDVKLSVGEEIRLAPSEIPVAARRVQWLQQVGLGRRRIGDASWNPIGVAALLGHAKPRSATGTPLAAGLLDRASEALNERQYDALVRATARDTFIWGPPGTGKSQVLAWVAAVLICSGRSVLLTACTNDIVDSLLKRTRALLDGPMAPPAGRNEYIETRWRTGERSRPSFVRLAVPDLHAATLARCILDPAFARDTLPDVVIVDEASHAMLPDLMVAASLAGSHVVLGGDPHQLGPVVTAREPDAMRVLRSLPFAGVTMLSREQAMPACSVMALEETYRLRPQAADGIRALSYKDTALRAVVPRREDCIRRPEVGQVRVVVPVGDAATMARTKGGLTGALIAWLLEQHGIGDPQQTVLVLAPYRRDLARIRGEIESEVEGGRLATRWLRHTHQPGEPACQPIRLSTIHSAQGHEAAIVIVDGTSYRWDSEFLAGTAPTHEGSRLWNVALSRATHHLVLVVPPDLPSRRGATWLDQYVAWACREELLLAVDVREGHLEVRGPGSTELLCHTPG